MFDPARMQIRDQVRRQMQAQGLGPGRTQPTLAEQSVALAMQLQRLARGLPPMAAGDSGPYDTPRNEFERTPLFGESLMRMLLRDPQVSRPLERPLPLLLEAIELERPPVLGGATQVAGGSE